MSPLKFITIDINDTIVGESLSVKEMVGVSLIDRKLNALPFHIEHHIAGKIKSLSQIKDLRQNETQVTVVIGAHQSQATFVSVAPTSWLLTWQQESAIAPELASLINGVPAIIFRAPMDDSYAASFISADVKDKLGYSVAEVVGKEGWWYDNVHPHDIENAIAAFSQWQEAQTPLPLTRRYRFRHKSGQYLWISEQVNRVSEMNELIGAISIIDNEERLREQINQLADLVPGMIYQLVRAPDGHMYFPYSSKGIERIYEFSPADVRHDATAVIDKIHVDDVSQLWSLLEKSEKHLIPWVCEYRVHLSTGEHWVYGHANPTRMEDGGTLWHGMIVNIDERKKLEHQLEQSHNRLQEAQRIGKLGHWEVILDTEELYWSDMVYELLGLQSNDTALSVDVFISLVHPEDQDKLKFLKAKTPTSAHFNVEHRLQHADGHYLWVQELAAFCPKGRALIGTLRDITEQKMLEQHLQSLAITDSLTSAFNRRYFVNEINAQIARSSRDEHPFCLAIFDIDHFKQVNDRYGHATGDAVLVSLVSLVQTRIRKSDIFARIGGEEFAILMPSTRLLDASTLLEDIHTLIRTTPATVNDSAISVTVTMGVAQFQLGDSWTSLLKRADKALYRGKQAGRDKIVTCKED